MDMTFDYAVIGQQESGIDQSEVNCLLTLNGSTLFMGNICVTGASEDAHFEHARHEAKEKALQVAYNQGAISHKQFIDAN